MRKIFKFALLNQIGLNFLTIKSKANYDVGVFGNDSRDQVSLWNVRYRTFIGLIRQC